MDIAKRIFGPLTLGPFNLKGDDVVVVEDDDNDDEGAGGDDDDDKSLTFNYNGRKSPRTC